ncbi:MAG: hypothetical protein ACXAD7_03585 [Candidatus Kariarchaeaceae archaeon]|jgi:hypothetical protein
MHPTMPKVTKESRLSFRISEEISDRIDLMVKEKEHLKDRSKFGTIATEKFMQYQELRPEFYDKMRKALLVISKNVGAEELDEIKQLLEDE